MFPDMFEIFNEDNTKEDAGESSHPTSSSSFVPTGISPVDSNRFFSISIGGSVLIDEKPNVAKIAKFSESINRLQREGYMFAIVVGGGKSCRNYQAAAKVLGANNFFLDSIGIDVTRINASLLTQAVENSFPSVITNIYEIKSIIESGRIPICGGMMPGFTTDAVATLIAEQMQGTFINLSNVDGVYSSDPKKSAHAKFYPEMGYERLISIIQMAEAKPGQNVILDMPASLILKRSKLKALFLNGNNLDNFEAAVRGLEFHGTVVSEMVSEQEAKTTGKRIPRKRHKIEAEEDDYEDPDPSEIRF